MNHAPSTVRQRPVALNAGANFARVGAILTAGLLVPVLVLILCGGFIILNVGEMAELFRRLRRLFATLYTGHFFRRKSPLVTNLARS
jgi:hypothetical protein